MNSFDIVIIGTSPLLLIKAIIEGRKGKKVCLIEKDNAIGGAWKGFKYKDCWYEGACHILDNKFKTHEIYKTFGIPTKRVDYDIIFSHKNKFYNINNIFHAAYLKSIVSEKILLKKILLFLWHIIKYNVFQKNKSFFFENGSQTMLNILSKQCISNKNISLTLNTEIIKIKQIKGKWESITNKGLVFKSDKLYQSLGSSLIRKNEEILLKLVLHIIISGRVDKKFKYFKIIDSHYLQRISIQDEFNNKQLLILETKSIHKKKFNIEKVALETIQDFLSITRIKEKNLSIVNKNVINSSSLIGISKDNIVQDIGIVINTKTLTSKHLIKLINI